jgi:site-specific recombinase XerD
LLLLEAGLRTQDVCGLRRSDLKLGPRKGAALVHGSKGDKDRTVPLGRDVRAAIKEYLAVRPVSSVPELFLSIRKAACHDDAVQGCVRRLGKVAGLEDLCPRALRHMFARNLLRRGVDIASVQALLGHTSVATTSIYVKASQTDLEDAVERLAWGDEE